MLKKSLRLRKKEDFGRVFRKGTPLFFGVLGCKIVKNDAGRMRMGFSLSKKHIERAASRNRLRRVLVAAFTGPLPVDVSKYSVDVVFFTVKKAEKSDIESVASWARSVVEYISNKL